MTCMSRENIIALFVFFVICMVVFKLETFTVIKQYFYLYWKVHCKLFACGIPSNSLGRVANPLAGIKLKTSKMTLE